MDTPAWEETGNIILSFLSDYVDLEEIAQTVSKGGKLLKKVTKYEAYRQQLTILTSKKEDISQIVYYNYRPFLEAVDSKETLIYRYKKFYSFVEECVDRGILTYETNGCLDVIESSIQITDYKAYTQLTEEMEHYLIDILSVEIDENGEEREIIYLKTIPNTDNSYGRDSVITLEEAKHERYPDGSSYVEILEY